MDKVELCKKLILDNRNISLKELSESLYVSKGACYNIISSLGCSKVCSHFVPKFLSADIEASKLQFSQSNLALYQQYGQVFLMNIVTEDETLLSLYVPDTQQDSMT